MNNFDNLFYKNRISKDEFGMLLALSAAQRSEDPHTQVGACIFCKNGDIKVGYNGAMAGYKLPKVSREEKLLYAAHAENNVLSFIRRGEADVMYITMSPCVPCAINIAAHGIKRVIFLEEYHRCIKFKKTFDYYGIKYERFSSDKIKKINTILSNDV